MDITDHKMIRKQIFKVFKLLFACVVVSFFVARCVEFIMTNSVSEESKETSGMKKFWSICCFLAQEPAYYRMSISTECWVYKLYWKSVQSDGLFNPWLSW